MPSPGPGPTTVIVIPAPPGPVTYLPRPDGPRHSYNPNNPDRSTPVPSSIISNSQPNPNGSNGSPTSSTTSSTTNTPVIVGSVAGFAALMAILATSVICYRRGRNSSRRRTLDILQAMDGPSSKGTSQNHLAASSPAMSGGVLDMSSAASGYDDRYDYEMQLDHNTRQGYGVHDSESSLPMFQTSRHPMVPPFAVATPMSRSQTGFDQNPTDPMYNGAPNGMNGAGYYSDRDLYSSSWNQQSGLWVMNPDTTYSDVIRHIYASGSATSLDKGLQSSQSLGTTIISHSPHPNLHRNANNPHAVPDSPTLQAGPTGCDEGETAESAGMPSSSTPSGQDARDTLVERNRSPKLIPKPSLPVLSREDWGILAPEL